MKLVKVVYFYDFCVEYYMGLLLLLGLGNNGFIFEYFEW